jgi:hypothetical protein
MDHKFTVRVDRNWIELWRLDSQADTYMYATEAHTGEPCLRMYINAIQVSELPHSERTCPKHDEPYSLCGALHYESKIFLVTRTPRSIATWKRNAIELAQRFRALKELAEREGLKGIKRVPMEGKFTKACRFCEFRTWCSNDRPLNMVKSMFVRDEWNPLADSQRKEKKQNGKPTGKKAVNR